MKKEYHLTISRKDRIYLVLFVTFLLGWELIKVALPDPRGIEFTAITPVQDSVSVSDSILQPKRKFTSFRKSYTDQHVGYEDEVDKAPKVEPYPVEIMEASLEELMIIGFSKKVAYNIQKYISVGGVIRDEKNLKKIYGVDTLQLQFILPYIIFPKIQPHEKTEFTFSKKETTELNTTVFDLNQATVEDLESLPGIGAVLAERIFKFRTSLGGFNSVNQITECYGLAPETFEKIKSRLILVQPAQKFSINQLDPKTFNHPYLEKKILYMLPNYIRNHGPIKNEEDLRKVFPPNPNWCDKLLPYLTFETKEEE